MIKTFICPNVKLPEKSIERSGQKRTRESDYTSKINFAKKSMPSQNFEMSKKEVSNILTEIKDLSATSFVGMAKKKHKEDKLTKLGAPPPKQQTMPFKMQMGILKGRKIRMTKAIQTAKEAGVVLAAPSKDQMKNSKRKPSKDRQSSFEVGTKGGILHLNKDKIPRRLLST